MDRGWVETNLWTHIYYQVKYKTRDKYINTVFGSTCETMTNSPQTCDREVSLEGGIGVAQAEQGGTGIPGKGTKIY